MTSGVTSSEVKPPRLFSLRTLHLFALSSFAITEPTLTALIGRTAYLSDHGIGLPEAFGLLFWLLIVIPLGWFALDCVAFHVSRRIRGLGADTAIFLLSGLLCLTLLRPYVVNRTLVQNGVSGLLALSCAGVGATVFVLMYGRISGFRSWVTVSSLGILVFPTVFIWQLHQFRRVEANLEGIAADHPVPIVMVVFDEFSGTTLLTEDQSVNSRRFPNFARLAEQATFYRNATTVHARTDISVPAIVSGRYPITTDHSPLEAELPGNLFQVLNASQQFDMAVFEPVTRICPRFSLESPLPDHRLFQRWCKLVHTMSAVYPRLALTNDLPLPLPAIPKAWFGIGYRVFPKSEQWDKMTEGLFNYSGGVYRAQQMDHFLRCLRPDTKARFAFLHVVFPHVPWTFFPDGEQYQSETDGDISIAGATGELGEDWLNEPATVLRNQYRYELQVGYADRFIGQLLDRLKETEQLDRCMLVVTADHGVSFRPNHSRRLPDAEMLPDIASVPLFIKFPGQAEGKIDDRNVQSIDIYPTIAEVLGLQLPVPVDGISVTQEKRHPRKSLYFNRSMTVMEPNFPSRLNAVKREWKLFGQRDLEELPEQASSHPDWHGRSVNSLTIDGATSPMTLSEPLRLISEEECLLVPGVMPNFVSGWINESKLPESPAELVVASDGVVQATGKTYWRSPRVQGFEFLIPRAQVSQGSPKIDLYVVDRSRNRLRQLEPSKVE